MNKTIRYWLLVSGVILVFAVAYGAVFSGPPTAKPYDNAIKVEWSTSDETSVQRFDILRQTINNGDFVLIKSLAPLGNNSKYEYLDQTVFKVQSGVFRYKIVAVCAGNVTFEIGPTSTAFFTSSAAKRTWGSIKAMFR
jgi:hypothetical protein